MARPCINHEMHWPVFFLFFWGLFLDVIKPLFHITIIFVGGLVLLVLISNVSNCGPWWGTNDNQSIFIFVKLPIFTQGSLLSIVSFGGRLCQVYNVLLFQSATVLVFEIVHGSRTCLREVPLGTIFFYVTIIVQHVFLNFFKPQIGVFAVCRVLAHVLQMLGYAVESIIKLLELCGNAVEDGLVFLNFLINVLIEREQFL